jgi:hypothetical protein
MRYFVVSVFCALLLGVFFVPRSFADEWDKATLFTFNQPVEVPGTVLSPGTYLFRLMDSPSDRDIVEIFNADGTHLYTTVMAIPDERLDPTSKTVVTLEERARKAPEAIESWFYPGDLSGLRFTYPKVETARLAQVSHNSRSVSSGLSGK